MGYGFEVQCKNCDYHKTLLTGTGEIPVYSKSLFKSSSTLIKSRKVKKEARDLLNEYNGIMNSNCGYEICYCSHCGELDYQFYFQITHDNGCYEPRYRCSNCRHMLLRVQLIMKESNVQLLKRNNEPIEWHCPQCGGRELQEKYLILWD